MLEASVLCLGQIHFRINLVGNGRNEEFGFGVY